MTWPAEAAEQNLASSINITGGDSGAGKRAMRSRGVSGGRHRMAPVRRFPCHVPIENNGGKNYFGETARDLVVLEGMGLPTVGSNTPVSRRPIHSPRARQ
jgi:hypothetical protein